MSSENTHFLIILWWYYFITIRDTNWAPNHLIYSVCAQEKCPHNIWVCLDLNKRSETSTKHVNSLNLFSVPSNRTTQTALCPYTHGIYTPLSAWCLATGFNDTARASLKQTDEAHFLKAWKRTLCEDEREHRWVKPWATLLMPMSQITPGNKEGFYQ